MGGTYHAHFARSRAVFNAAPRITQEHSLQQMEPSFRYTLSLCFVASPAFPLPLWSLFLFAGLRFFSSPLADDICPARPFLLPVLLGSLKSHLLAASLLPEQPLALLPLQFGSHLCDLSASQVLISPRECFCGGCGWVQWGTRWSC